jgi:hypothetical protein
VNKLSNKIIKIVKNISIIYVPYLFARDLNSYFRYLLKGQFSQHGEDTFLLNYFGKGFKGTYIDIGSSHPFRISNTYCLYRNGWNGIAVDPIPAFKLLYRFWRPRDKFLNLGIAPESGTLNYYELTPSVLSSFNKNYIEDLIKQEKAEIQKNYIVNVITPDHLFELYAKDNEVNFLSIDIEGLDISVLKAINFKKYRPALIGIEFNNESDKIEIINFLNSVQYKCDIIIGCNIFAERT